MTRTIYQLALRIPADAEDAVQICLEEALGHRAVIYTDAETKKAVASVYLTDPADWNSLTKCRLQEALRETDVKIAGLQKARLQRLRKQDWAESWKKHFQPIEIGNRLLIRPSWSQRKPKRGQAVLVLDPGLSFGTGQHATTRFCLEQLVAGRREGTAQSFLDMGSGSGILALAAARLGYEPIEAFDFDPEAVRISRENARNNNLEKQVRPARRDLRKLPLRSRRRFDFICANLLSDLLVDERNRITARLAVGGTLVLAGILKSQFAEVQSAYEAAGMKLRKANSGKEWRSGAFVFAK